MAVFAEPDMSPEEMVDNACAVISLLKEAIALCPNPTAELSTASRHGLFLILHGVEETLQAAFAA